MENCVFRQIITEENTPLRVHFTYLKESVTVILLDNENAWKTTMSTEGLKHFAREHKLGLEEYCMKLINYIKSAGPDIQFSLKNESFFIDRLLENSLKVKFFTCKLEQVNYKEQVEQILDNVYLENSQLWEKLKTVTREKDEIDEQKRCCELKLQELVEKKSADEEDQFGKFVSVLNEKKRRILHLTELLEAFKNGRSTVNPPVTAKSRKRKSSPVQVSSKKLETISESEDSNYEIDESSESDEKPPNNTEKDSPPPDDCKPSTSTQDFDFLNDDDLPKTGPLPKRTRQEKPPSDIIVRAATPSPPKTEPEEAPKNSRSRSPVIDINTQQLLDML